MVRAEVDVSEASEPTICLAHVVSGSHPDGMETYATVCVLALFAGELTAMNSCTGMPANDHAQWLTCRS